MKRIKVLLLDQYHYWINSTNYTSPHLLDQIVDLKIFGPGFVKEDDLKKGLINFIDKNKGFDVYASTANFCFRKNTNEWTKYNNSYLLKTGYIPYEKNHIKHMQMIERDFASLSGPKVLFFINNHL